MRVDRGVVRGISMCIMLTNPFDGELDRVTGVNEEKL